MNRIFQNSTDRIEEFTTQCLALNMYSFYQHPKFYRKHSSEMSDEPETGITADSSLLLDNDEHFLLCRTIEAFKHVETLVLPTVCDDAALCVIATNCER